MANENGGKDVHPVRSFVVRVNGSGLDAIPCGALRNLSAYYFPEAEITVTNLENGKDGHLKKVITLLRMIMYHGNRIQFTCRMNDASFKVFKNIILQLRDNADSLSPLSDGSGDIERLIRELEEKAEGKKLFSTRSKAEKK